MTKELRHYLAPYSRREENDPLFEELTYGHKNSLNTVKEGEYLFFHTKILDKRYITAYYQVFSKKTVFDIKSDKLIRNKYKNHHIENGSDSDTIVFGHPIYSYLLHKPLLLTDKLLFDLTNGKKINQGKLIMAKGKKGYLLDLIEKHDNQPLNQITLSTEDIFHLRERDIENLLCNDPTLLGTEMKYINRQRHFKDRTILDVQMEDEKGSVIVEIKKGLINQDVYEQINGYIKNYKSEENIENVRGIIICRGFDSDQTKEFFTEKINKGKIEVYLHAWRFNLRQVNAGDLINI